MIINKSVLIMAKNKISSNEITLRAYDYDIESYLKHTPATYDKSHEFLLRWINLSLGLSDKKGHILEIGSGSGRDALYIKSKGHKITCSDASAGFLQHLRQLPVRTLELNLIKDALPNGYSMIFANAVLPHFTKKETGLVIHKIYNALPANGIFAFSVKQGIGSLWTDEKLRHKRYINFWQPQAIIEIVTQAGFKIMYKKMNAPGDLKTHTWTHLTLKK